MAAVLLSGKLYLRTTTHYLSCSGFSETWSDNILINLHMNRSDESWGDLCVNGRIKFLIGLKAEIPRRAWNVNNSVGLKQSELG